MAKKDHPEVEACPYCGGSGYLSGVIIDTDDGEDFAGIDLCECNRRHVWVTDGRILKDILKRRAYRQNSTDL